MTKVTRFTAEWCSPCAMLKPVLEDILKEFPNVQYEVIDADENPEEITRLNIRALPTVIVASADVEERFSGVKTRKDYTEAIKNAIKREG